MGVTIRRPAPTSSGALPLRAVGEPTPERPGPGPMPDALLRALDLTIGRRVEGLLAGEHRSRLLGRGTELAQVRPYVPGDDVRLIDWNVTARTGEPHVRVHLAERVLVTWIALDLSPSMAFGTADRRKADVAVGATVALAHAATVRGNRAGLVGFGNGDLAVHPPRQGRAGLLAVLSALGQDPADGRPGLPLAQTLRRLSGIARRDSLVAVVSDFRGPLDWHRPLLELAGSHDLLAVEIRDRREQQLAPVGELWLIDAESGRKLRVDTNDVRLRERFAAAAAAEREAVARTLASCGAAHVVLSTEGDWLRNLAACLRSRGRRR
jgi:uncharacterized protein (DUF58 family)